MRKYITLILFALSTLLTTTCYGASEGDIVIYDTNGVPQAVDSSVITNYLNKTYYVVPTYTDGAGDGSYDSPWQTISAIDWDVIHPGDELNGTNGTYTGVQLIIGKGGNQGSPITISDFILDGNGSVGPLVSSSDNDHLIIKNIELRNSFTDGIKIDTVYDLYMENIFSHDNIENGINISGSKTIGITIKSCTTYNNGWDGLLLASSDQTNTYIRDILVSECYSSGDYNDGIAVKTGVNVIVEKSLVRDSVLGDNFDCGGYGNITFRYNKSVNSNSGNFSTKSQNTGDSTTYYYNNISIGGHEGIDIGYTSNVYLYNNLITGATTFGLISWWQANLVAKNNVIYNNSELGDPAASITISWLGTDATLVSDYNLVYPAQSQGKTIRMRDPSTYYATVNDWKASNGLIYDQNTLDIDPLLNSGSFTPSKLSPLIGAGVSTGENDLYIDPISVWPGNVIISKSASNNIGPWSSEAPYLNRVEGNDVLSTGETSGIKVLVENGAGGSSWEAKLGLSKVDEGSGQGWVLTGRVPENYGPVGLDAIDLSYSAVASISAGATGKQSFAYGYSSKASGDYSSSGGYKTEAAGDNSRAEGYSAVASGIASHAEGDSTIASGDRSHAEGSQTIASGLYSHAEGAVTQALGDGSHAEGINTVASGNASHVEGNQTQATSPYAHAEGINTVASGNVSHAEGSGTTASGYISHSEGEGTTASGAHSHAEGYYTVASGDRSHAQGRETIALNSGSFVAGRYNVGTDLNTVVEIGIGTDDLTRANALEIYTDGSATLPEVTIAEIDSRGATALVTKEYSDNANGVLRKETADPCATLGEGILFYNDTSDYMCFCTGAAVDVQVQSPTTACF